MLKAYAFSSLFLGALMIASGVGALLEFSSLDSHVVIQDRSFPLRNYQITISLLFFAALLFMVSGVGIFLRKNWGRLILLGLVWSIFLAMIVLGVYININPPIKPAVTIEGSNIARNIVLLVFGLLAYLFIHHLSGRGMKDQFFNKASGSKQPEMGEVFKFGIVVTLFFGVPLFIFISFLFTEYIVRCRAAGWERNMALKHANVQLMRSFEKTPNFRDFVLKEERFQPYDGWWEFIFQTNECEVSIDIDECGMAMVGVYSKNCKYGP